MLKQLFAINPYFTETPNKLSKNLCSMFSSYIVILAFKIGKAWFFKVSNYYKLYRNAVLILPVA